MASIDPKVTAYLEALKTADPQGFSRPPGLGNVWRNRFITAGLKRQVIVVHSSGRGLAFVIPKAHGVCQSCATRRGVVCEHCNCSLCIFEREAMEYNSPPVSPEKVRLLSDRLRALQFQPKKRAMPSLIDGLTDS